MFINLFVIASILATVPIAIGLLLGFEIGVLAAGHRVRQLRAELSDLTRRLIHDDLTGLYNRTGLRAAYDAATSGESRRIVAMFVDLDRFKEVNDLYGHDAGDELLKQTAHRLARLAGQHGGTAARLAGDEYAIILSDYDGDIAEFASRVNLLLAAPVHVHTLTGATDITLTASLGITATEGATPLEAVLRQADTAMYHAKSQGGNRQIIYTSGMSMPGLPHRHGLRLRDLRPGE